MKTILLLSTLAASILFAAPAGASPAPSTFGPTYPYPPACDFCRPFWGGEPRREVIVRQRVQHHHKRAPATTGYAPR
jgi:hypothetical protein